MSKELQTASLALTELSTEVSEQMRALIQAGTPENTQKTYAKHLKYWKAWCDASHIPWQLPLALHHVLQFITNHLVEMPPEVDQQLVQCKAKRKVGTVSLNTVRARLALLSFLHERQNLKNPVHDIAVRELLSKAGNIASFQAQKKKAVTLHELEQLLLECPNDLKGTRDRAILCVTFAAGGRRRSEIAALDYDDLTPVGEHFSITIQRSKTDQSGEGLVVPIMEEAADALRKWLEMSQIQSGKLFRGIDRWGNLKPYLPAEQVSLIVKRYAQKAGLNPSQFGAHSLRSGFITEAGRQGIHLGEAMGLTGHKTLRVALGYYQSGHVFQNQAANLLSKKKENEN